MSSLYDKVDKENFKYWHDDVLQSIELRKRFPVIILTHDNHVAEEGFDVECPQCDAILRAQFGKYDRPIDNKAIFCTNGPPEDGHGFWATVVNLILN